MSLSAPKNPQDLNNPNPADAKPTAEWTPAATASANDFPGISDVRAPRARFFGASVQGSYNPQAAPSATSAHFDTAQPAAAPDLREGFLSKLFRFVCVALSVFWMGGWFAFSLPTIHSATDLGLMIAAGCSPVLVLAFILTGFSRHRDAQIYARALKSELASVLMPGDARSKLIGDELSAMLDQAADITRTTRATLGTLQDMREGIREELKEFATLTRLAQSHLNELGAEVENKTGHMGALAEQLDGVLNRLHDTTSDAELRLQTVRTTMETTTEKLTGATTGAEERMSTLGTAFDARVASVAAMTERVAGEVARLETLVQDQNNKLSQAVAAMVEQVGDASAQFDAGRTVLEAERKALKAVQEGIVRTMSDTTSALERTAELTHETGQKTSKGLDAEAVKLQSALASWNDLLKTFETRMQDHQSLHGEVAQSITQLGDLSDKSADNVRTMTSLLQDSLGRMGEVGAAVDARVKQIGISVDRQSEALRLSGLTLAERAEQTETRLGNVLGDIQKAIATLDTRHGSFDETLQRRLTDLQEAASKILTDTDALRLSLRQQVQDMAGATGEIAGHAQSITQQLGQHRDDIKTVVAVSEQDAQALLQSLASVVTELRRASQEQQNAGKIGVSDMQATIARLDTAKASLQAALESGLGSLETSHGKLETTAADATRTLQGIGKQIDDSVLSLTPRLVQSNEDASRLVSQIQTLTNSTKSSLGQLTQHMTETETVLDARLKSLSEAGDITNTKLKAVGEVALTGLEALNGAAQSAESRVRQLGQLMERQGDNVHLLTDRFVGRVELVQKQLDEGFRDLSSAIGQAIAQMEAAGQTMSRQAASAETDAGKVIEGLARTGDKAKLETGQMLAQLGLLQAAMTELAGQAAKQQSTLLDSSDTAVEQVKAKTAQLESLVAKTRELLAKDASVMAGKVTEIETKIIEVGATSMASGQSIQSILEALGKQVDVIESRISHSDKQLEQSIERLNKGGAALNDITARTVQSAGQAGENITRSTIQLEGMVTRIQQAAHDLKDNQIQVQRDAFMTSARFVLESLHALSVDFVRGIEGDMPEKAWKAYEKGDVTALTKRLVSMTDRMPLDRLRDKVADDSEFRTYVQRFIHLFEGLIEQAEKTDASTLLVGGFLTSDLGRIYGLMCQATGRDAKRLL